MLQSPTQVELKGQNRESLIFALQETDMIIHIASKFIGTIEAPVRFALEHHLGCFALYHAQIKWNFPTAVGSKHIKMRDHYMHGHGHVYDINLSDLQWSEMMEDIAYVSQTRSELVNLLLNSYTKKVRKTNL